MWREWAARESLNWIKERGGYDWSQGVSKGLCFNALGGYLTRFWIWEAGKGDIYRLRSCLI